MASSRRKIRMGIVQPDVILGDIPTNLSFVYDTLHTLGKEGVHLALLPELWSSGFDHDLLLAHGEKTPGILGELSRISAAYQMVIGGSLPEKEGKTLYNTLYLHDACGRLAASYRKAHLFTLTGEERFFGKGDEAVFCDTKVGRVGLLICYDLRFPELCRMLALNGAEIILVSAQWPEARIAHWDTLLKARAIENQVFVAASNRRGEDILNRFCGHSQIVSPWGRVVGLADSACSLLYGEIDLAEIDQVRAVIPALRERRPDIYG